MSPEFALLCLLLPALVSLCLMLGNGVMCLVRRRRSRSQCHQHVRAVLLTERHGPVELCCTCDAGHVVDGRWQFAAAVEADHTLG